MNVPIICRACGAKGATTLERVASLSTCRCGSRDLDIDATAEKTAAPLVINEGDYPRFDYGDWVIVNGKKGTVIRAQPCYRPSDGANGWYYDVMFRGGSEQTFEEWEGEEPLNWQKQATKQASWDVDPPMGQIGENAPEPNHKVLVRSMNPPFEEKTIELRAGEAPPEGWSVAGPTMHTNVGPMGNFTASRRTASPGEMIGPLGGDDGSYGRSDAADICVICNERIEPSDAGGDYWMHAQIGPRKDHEPRPAGRRASRRTATVYCDNCGEASEGKKDGDICPKCNDGQMGKESRRTASRDLVCGRCNHRWTSDAQYNLDCPSCGASESVKEATRRTAAYAEGWYITDREDSPSGGGQPYATKEEASAALGTLKALDPEFARLRHIDANGVMTTVDGRVVRQMGGRMGAYGAQECEVCGKPIVTTDRDDNVRHWNAEVEANADHKAVKPGSKVASKIEEIAAGIRASNPGMSRSAALQVATKTVQRYPRVASDTSTVMNHDCANCGQEITQASGEWIHVGGDAYCNQNAGDAKARPKQASKTSTLDSIFEEVIGS